MKRVLIVNDGGSGMLSARRGGYDSLCVTLKAGMERLKADGKPSEVTVEIVDAPTARSILMSGSSSSVHTVIYVTNGLIDEADAVRRLHSRVQVIVLTGAQPDRVVVLRKAWVTPDLMRQLV